MVFSDSPGTGLGSLMHSATHDPLLSPAITMKNKGFSLSMQIAATPSFTLHLAISV
jgi:hypothetical protein